MSSRITFLVLLVGGCAGPKRPGDGPPPDPVAAELQRLEGDWTIVGAEPAELKQTGTATFRGDTVTFKGRDPLRFTVDPTRDPKWIDIYPERLWESLKTGLPGIYILDGDRLTLYLITEVSSEEPPARPKGFDEKCPGQILHLERAKKSP